MASAIVILNWNDWKNTIDCLESIYQNEGNFDVFLIDNGSYLKNILNVSSWYNGKLISDGNTNDLYHPFTKMIERASLNAELKPGDYIGSGTVGTGCILELRPENTNGWLKKGDVITLEVEKLGVLENKIV